MSMSCFSFIHACNIVKSVFFSVNGTTGHPIAQAGHFGVILKSFSHCSCSVHQQVLSALTPTHILYLASSLHPRATTLCTPPLSPVWATANTFPSSLLPFISAIPSPQSITLLQTLCCLVFLFPLQPHWLSLYTLLAGPLHLLLMFLGMVWPPDLPVVPFLVIRSKVFPVILHHFLS